MLIEVTMVEAILSTFCFFPLPILWMKYVADSLKLFITFKFSFYRFLFWTDAGLKFRLLRSRLDGQKKQMIAEEKDQITGLTIDRVDDLVFWSTKEHINVADLSGKNV